MKTTLLALALTALACPALAHDNHKEPWWYTSATGPYQDESFNPYRYYNYGYQPYPYTNVPGATGPYLYFSQGYIPRENLTVVHQVKEVVQEKPAPAPEPPPAEEPKAKPEGD